LTDFGEGIAYRSVIEAEAVFPMMHSEALLFAHFEIAFQELEV
jgi:hypothetical protein